MRSPTNLKTRILTVRMKKNFSECLTIIHFLNVKLTCHFKQNLKCQPILAVFFSLFRSHLNFVVVCDDFKYVYFQKCAELKLPPNLEIINLIRNESFSNIFAYQKFYQYADSDSMTTLNLSNMRLGDQDITPLISALEVYSTYDFQRFTLLEFKNYQKFDISEKPN